MSKHAEGFIYIGALAAVESGASLSHREIDEALRFFCIPRQCQICGSDFNREIDSNLCIKCRYSGINFNESEPE